MIGKLKVIAVIPARGGSKVLHNKNIIDLCGKPLIAYTIEAALKSKYIDRVIVSTDSEKITIAAKKFGAEVPFVRPDYLATDKAHTLPVIEHAVKFIEKQSYNADFVVTLQPTSPLRKIEQIDEAIELMHKSKLDSVVSVKPADYPPYWVVKVKNSRIIPFINDGTDYFKKERQQLPKTHQINGAIYVTKKDVLYEKKVVISKNCGAIIMDNKTSLDIDTELDLKYAEFLLKESMSAL